MDPWQVLAEQIRDETSLPVGVSVYDGPTNQLVPPAVVIRPDSPWLEVARQYCLDLQRYVAVAVVSASDASSGLSVLYRIQWAVRAATEALGNGWEWVSVGAPVIDQSTGSAYLAAPIRLEYRNSNEPQEAS